MAKTDILIIGGGPAGVTCALTARKNYPEKEIILVRDREKSVIPCGIPYIFYRLKSAEEDILPDKILEDNDIKLLIQKAVEILIDNKKVRFENGKEIEYEKLVLATGSEPVFIPIKGIDKKGVFVIKKDLNYLKELREAVLEAKNIVIIGGGFIGVEVAEEISRIKGKNISIVERGSYCLETNFDEEFTKVVEEKLKEKGVKLYTGKVVEEIGGREKVEYVRLNSKEKLPCDLVLLSVGARPNIQLAKTAGIKVMEKGGIWVDEYLRTNIADIFAVGDCAQTKDFFTRKDVPIMLASTACYEARIAGSNLYKIQNLKENKGTLGAFSTSIFGLGLGAAGMTEKIAKKEKFDYVVGKAKIVNRHPGKLPGAESIFIKLIFLAGSEGYLLGGEVMGPESIGETVNIISLLIQQKMSAFDLQSLQISTHPLLTASPISYPLIVAAQDAIKKMRGKI